MYQPIDEHLIQFARELRKNQTCAESLMWQVLRSRRFAGLKFRRQHPIEPYILDFYCHELKLAVELDGSQHNEASGLEADQHRTAYLKAQGLEVVRYWNNDVLKQPEIVLGHLWNVVQEKNR